MKIKMAIDVTRSDREVIAKLLKTKDKLAQPADVENFVQNVIKQAIDSAMPGVST